MARKLLVKNCDHCGRKFQTYEKEKKFCTQDCLFKHTIIDYAEKIEKKDPKVKNKRIGTCKNCSKTFVQNPNTIKFFCSGPCRYANKYKEELKRKEKNCQGCGGKFMSQYNEVFCSDNCKTIESSKAKKDYKKQFLQEKKNNLKNVSYEELNRRAEEKRLNDEWRNISRWKFNQ